MNYPDLSKEKIIAVDIETKDPELIDHGPGVYRKDGYILGVSIATTSGFSEYYPLESGIPAGYPPYIDRNLAYLKEILSLNCDKVGANFMYDLDWLINGYGFVVNGTYHDIQTAEPLLDEYRRSYSLDNLALDYLGIGKQKTEIEAWCTERKLSGDPRKHLWKMPIELVGRYAKVDALRTLQVFEKQLPKLEAEGLTELYNMEIGLFPLLLKMRKNGVPIDEKKLINNIDFVTEKLVLHERKLFEDYGEFNINSGPQIAKVFTRLGLDYPKTEKGNPSLDSKVLGRMGGKLGQDILQCRKLKTSLAFLKNSFQDNLVKGYIHGSFNPLRSDDYGTVSGRFSASNPNLQQVTSVRDEDKDPYQLGHRAREIFIPESGMLWGKIDYSQIEYRMLAHYAQGPKAQEIRNAYNNDPKTDYHAWVMGLTGLDRKKAKNLNFGAVYCMGANTCADTFGWDLEESRELLSMYHAELPFIRYTLNQVTRKARMRDQQNPPGFIKTILGRKARVNDIMRGLNVDRREKYYSLLNRLFQGSAADIMKKAMVEADKAGLFETLKLHLTVHDELDFSYPDTKQGKEAYKELKHIMETCVECKVPLIAEAESGSNWADVKEIKL